VRVLFVPFAEGVSGGRFWYLDNWNGGRRDFQTKGAAIEFAQRECGTAPIRIYDELTAETFYIEPSGYCYP